MKIDRDAAAAAALGAGSAGPASSAAARPTADRHARGAQTHGSHATDAGRPAATISLSSRSRELHDALRAAHAAADVRSDRVNAVRTRIEGGAYTIDAAAIAGSMLDRRA